MINKEHVLQKLEEIYSELEQAPDNPDLLNDLGVGYYLIGEYDQSIRKLEEAVKIKPDSVSFLFNLGNSYAENDNFSEAILQFLKALELNPEHLPSLNNLANCYDNTRNTENAFELFSYITKIAHEDPFAHFNLGNFLLRNNRHIEAVKRYEKVFELDSGFTDAFYNIAWILSEAGATSEALSYIEKGLKTAPNDEDLLKLRDELKADERD